MEKQPTPTPPSQPEFVNLSDEETLQYAIDMDGGLYDQALAADPKETLDAQKRSQKEAYGTYAENIKVTKRRERRESIDEFKDSIKNGAERLKRISKRTVNALGSAAMREILPLANEYMQRRNSHTRMKYSRGNLMPEKPIMDKSLSEADKFQQSVEDFENIKIKEDEMKKAEAADRRARREAFFQ